MPLDCFSSWIMRGVPVSAQVRSGRPLTHRCGRFGEGGHRQKWNWGQRGATEPWCPRLVPPPLPAGRRAALFSQCGQLVWIFAGELQLDREGAVPSLARSRSR